MSVRERFLPSSEAIIALLLFAAFILIQVLIGGTRLVFSLPAYIIIGLAGLFTIVSLGQRRPEPCRSCLIATAVAFTYVIGRALLSPAPYIARSDLYSALGALVVYLAFALVVTNNNRRIIFVLGLLVFAIVHVLIGAIQFRDGNNFMPISWLQRYDYGTRASGFYVCPNHLAGLLEVVGVIGLSIACWSRWPVWAKLLVGYAAACCYVGLIITGSRGGYISAGVSLLTFAVLSLIVLRQTTPKFFWKISGAAAGGAIVVTVLVTLLMTRNLYLSHRAQNVIDPTNIRRDLWDAAMRQWQVAPLTGTGSGTYLYYGRFFRNPGMQHDPVYVHNDYLHLAAEYGAIGVVVIGILVLVHVRRGLLSFSRIGPKRVALSHQLVSNGLALNIGALAAVAAYAVHEVFDFNLHIPANALLMGFVFGLLANHAVARDADASKAARRDFAWRLALVSLALVLLVQSAHLLPGEYYSERARMAVRDNHPAIAILNATRGIAYDPRNPDLYARLGAARMELGDAMNEPAAANSFYDDAVDALGSAHTLAPQDSVSALELANALDSAQRFDEAEWMFYESIRLDPKSDSLRTYYQTHLQAWEQEGAPKPAS